MSTVGEDCQDGDDVNDDNLDHCAPLVGLHVDGGGAVHRLQPVQGNGRPAQSGDVYGDSLIKEIYFTSMTFYIIFLMWLRLKMNLLS